MSSSRRELITQTLQSPISSSLHPHPSIITTFSSILNNSYSQSRHTLSPTSPHSSNSAIVKPPHPLIPSPLATSKQSLSSTVIGKQARQETSKYRILPPLTWPLTGPFAPPKERAKRKPGKIKAVSYQTKTKLV